MTTLTHTMLSCSENSCYHAAHALIVSFLTRFVYTRHPLYHFCTLGLLCFYRHVPECSLQSMCRSRLFKSLCAICLLGYHSSQLSGIGRCSEAIFCFALLVCLCVLPVDGPLSVRTVAKSQRKATAVAVSRFVESYLSPADTMNIPLWFFFTVFSVGRHRRSC